MKTYWKTTALGTALAALVLLDGGPAYACSSDPYLGSVCITAAAFCPKDYYVEAAGQVLPIAENQALYSLLGTTYGGNRTTNFALPDLRGRTPVGVGQGLGLHPVDQGIWRGIESTTLTTGNLPSHSHEATFTPSGGGDLSVDIPVSSNTGGNKNIPDATYSYLAGSVGGPPGAAIWSDTMNEAASVKGVTVSGEAGGGTVEIGDTGGGQAFPNIPPQLGLQYCIAIKGTYPSRN